MALHGTTISGGFSWSNLEMGHGEVKRSDHGKGQGVIKLVHIGGIKQ